MDSLVERSTVRFRTSRAPPGGAAGGSVVRGAHAAEELLERARRELLRNRTTDAAARAGYEGCGSGEVHGG